MQTVLIVIHLIVVIALVITVLLQRSEGGALGVGGGGGFMTGRGQANVLTRATAILAALFFTTSLALTILANLHRAPKSIFEGTVPATQAPVQGKAPEQSQGNLLDQLRQMEDRRQPSAPAPLTPPEPSPVTPSAPTPGR
ncbi:preprotein translocase subunit SecG [Beijerinckia indica]|uniref:Protein-export membrane protein SecG n=1 Tax=Beijerinckia indica subsp. indica (strain ATCC 9039 / DSM 1715 / NCIMB 8712) TaxID=395963 RepID=B2IKQ1_BEII9|nr:preprotein translocase subunit SecG [Beijerinckia indica]ACB95090.1 preprotein translocase, SecG subunit [Beijerinckia indica subsp. indica ATCC 9039]